MASSVKSRIRLKADTTANWNTTAGAAFVPQSGEVCIYLDAFSKTESGVTTYKPGIKVGDGAKTVANLPFVNEGFIFDNGVLGADKGGTGRTSLLDSANALIAALPTYTDDLTDNWYIVCWNPTTTKHGYSKNAKVWDYIKSKADSTYLSSASAVPVTKGGTGATTAAQARTNLGIPSYSAGTGISFSSDNKISVKTGYTTSGKNYKVQADTDGNLYVNVPWTDNNTTYSAGTGLSLTNGSFSVKTGYTTSGKNYKVQADTNGNLYVNVPWTDNNTTYSAGTGLSLSGTTFSISTVPAANGGTGQTSLVNSANALLNALPTYAETDLPAHWYAVGWTDDATKNCYITSTKLWNFIKGKADSTYDSNTIVIPATRGGTGQTSLKSSANALIAALPTYTDTPTHDWYLISWNPTTREHGYTQYNTAWNYFKTKADQEYLAKGTGGALAVSQGGTGATTAAGALANLGAVGYTIVDNITTIL